MAGVLVLEMLVFVVLVLSSAWKYTRDHLESWKWGHLALAGSLRPVLVLICMLGSICILKSVCILICMLGFICILRSVCVTVRRQESRTGSR